MPVSDPMDAHAALLPLHFDVPGHSLSAAHYIVAVKAMQTSLEELNKRAFEGKLVFDFLVLPNEDGSFKGITSVLVKGVRNAKGLVIVAGALFATVEFSETDMFRGLVKGLTGYELDHYKAGEKVGELIRDIAVGIFSTKNDDLNEKIPASTNLDKVIRAKSDFYSACIQNEQVRGVGFEDSDVFPIKREHFPLHVSRDRIRQAPSEFRLYDAIIVSPVDVDRDTKWVFQDKASKEIIKAHMRDQAFRRGFLSGSYPLKRSNLDDEVKILVEYSKEEKNGEVGIKDIFVKTVYSFNGQAIPGAPPVPVDVASIAPDPLPFERYWESDR